MRQLWIEAEGRGWGLGGMVRWRDRWVWGIGWWWLVVLGWVYV